MKKKGILLFIAVFVVSGFVACGGGKKQVRDKKKADPNRAIAEGYAKVWDDDEALARDRALDDARRKLISKVLGTTISGKAVMQNYRLVSKIVEAKSFGIVKDEIVLKKWRDGTVIWIRLQGTVEPAAVNDVIEKALDDYGRPKFMMLVRETFDGKRNMPGFTETEIVAQELMGNSGFEFVDAAMTQQLMRKERRKMTNAMNGNVRGDTQQVLLNNAGAEVIIVGTAVTNDQSGTLRSYKIKNMKSKSAIIRIKAIDVYTGRILHSMSRQAPGLHIDDATASKKAIENALKQILGDKDENGDFVTGDFINVIVKKFVKAANARQINVSISGLDYQGLSKFRNEISYRIRGVQRVIPKGQAGNISRVEVYFAGKTTDFADELLAKSDKLGFEVDVKESYPNKLILNVKKIE